MTDPERAAPDVPTASEESLESAEATAATAATPDVARLGVICPVCRVVAEREVEAARATAGKDRVLELCPRHVWLAMDLGARAEEVAAALGVLLEHLNSSRPFRDAPHASAGCPVCHQMDQAAFRALEHGADASTLCLPHAALAIHHGGAISPRDFVASGRDLEHELSELIRKADYRFRDEPRGAERDSWLRALARVSGAPGVRRYAAPRRRGAGSRR